MSTAPRFDGPIRFRLRDDTLLLRQGCLLLRGGDLLLRNGCLLLRVWVRARMMDTRGWVRAP